jgi:hypothetical protein
MQAAFLADQNLASVLQSDSKLGQSLSTVDNLMTALHVHHHGVQKHQRCLSLHTFKFVNAMSPGVLLTLKVK